MTTYWIDYSASSNGSGTYASPYDGSAGVPGYTITGDEIRIKSHSLANLTDFTFTATFTTTSSNYNTAPYLEVSDASLFTVGDICMYDTDKTCFRVKSIDTSVTPERIYTGADFAFRPVHAWNVTDGSFRRLDPTYYPSDHHFYLQFEYFTDSNSCTVSDGWYSETERVTDKSYMTIIASSQTSTSNRYLYVKQLGYGTTINLTNTCCVSQWDKDFQVKDIFKYMNNCTMNFHDLWGGRWNGGFYSASSSVGENNTLTVDYMTTYYGFSGSGAWRGINDTIQINTHTQYNTYMNTRDNPSTNNTFIQGDILTRSNGGSLLDYSHSPEWNYQFNGVLQGANTGSPSWLVYGAKSVIIGSGFGVTKKNYSTPETLTSMSKCINGEAIDKMHLDYSSGNPVTNNSSSFTFTDELYLALYFASDKYAGDRINPNKVAIHDGTIIYDSAQIGFSTNNFPKFTSFLVRNINASSPEEYEQLQSSYNYTPANGIKITKDTSTYKTTSPALKCNLQTFSTSYSNMEFVKAINIPVDGDDSTEFTVTGWVKSDAGMFDTNKLKARVVYDDNVAVTENINITNAEAGWVQFSLAFTPNDKQLAQFQLRMHPQAGAKSVWLSDVAVA